MNIVKGGISPPSVIKGLVPVNNIPLTDGGDTLTDISF
jgi:hypothetical protein